MRKLLKVLLPVLIDFAIFWAVVKYYTPAHTMKLVDIGNGNLYSLMAYFHLFWPLLLVVGILTQYLVVVPLWDNKAVKSLRARIIIGFCIALVCIIFAGAISYIIWDPAYGQGPLLSFWWYLSEIQLFYWVFTFVVLFLIDRRKFLKTQATEEIESPV